MFYVFIILFLVLGFCEITPYMSSKTNHCKQRYIFVNKLMLLYLEGAMYTELIIFKKTKLHDGQYGESVKLWTSCTCIAVFF